MKKVDTKNTKVDPDDKAFGRMDIIDEANYNGMRYTVDAAKHLVERAHYSGAKVKAIDVAQDFSLKVLENILTLLSKRQRTIEVTQLPNFVTLHKNLYFQNLSKSVATIEKTLKQQQEAISLGTLEVIKMRDGTVTGDQLDIQKKKQAVKKRIRKEVWCLDVINEHVLRLLGSDAYQNCALEMLYPEMPPSGESYFTTNFISTFIRKQFSARLFAFMYTSTKQ